MAGRLDRVWHVRRIVPRPLPRHCDPVQNRRMRAGTQRGQLAVEWCLIEDPELAWKFTVSPRSGRMVALPPRLDPTHDTAQAALRMHGLHAGEKRIALHCDDSRQGPVGEPLRPARARQRLALHARWSLCAALARRLPLRTALEFLTRLPADVGERSPRSILDRVAYVERQLHPQLHTRQCLPRAMLRFWMLVPLQPRIEFNLGVWVPTQLMHAWVSLDAVPFGEEREEVMHYRPCVRMTWRRDAY